MNEHAQPASPRIAFAMADDYAWDVIRQQQLPECDFEIWSDCLDWDEEELLRRVRGVTAVVTGRKSRELPAGLIDDPGAFRVLIHCHGGVRNRISEAHLRAGITVTNWGRSQGNVAEAAMALMLACLKQLPSLHAYALSDRQVDGRIYQNFPCRLHGAKIGLYGFGPIGQDMAQMLRGFEPDLAIYDPFAKSIPEGITVCQTLAELFDRSNIISIHCGLNDATCDSVNGDLLDRLPQGGVVINTARGAIVDEAALSQRVHAGRLLAGLDVIRDEQHWSQSPLAGSPHVIFGAHRSSSGKGCEPALRGPRLLPEFVVANIHAVINNTPLVNVVTAEEYALKT
jgi:D-3-phosphoglycerate dehydrogenase